MKTLMIVLFFLNVGGLAVLAAMKEPLPSWTIVGAFCSLGYLVIFKNEK